MIWHSWQTLITFDTQLKLGFYSAAQRSDIRSKYGNLNTSRLRSPSGTLSSDSVLIMYMVVNQILRTALTIFLSSTRLRKTLWTVMPTTAKLLFVKNEAVCYLYWYKANWSLSSLSSFSEEGDLILFSYQLEKRDIKCYPFFWFSFHWRGHNT